MATLMRSSLNNFPRFAQRLTAFRAYQRASPSSVAATESKPIGEKWTLTSAVCLERYPTIVPQRTSLEDRISINLQKIELERSVLCDHELKHLEDMAKKKQIQEESGSLEMVKGGEVSAGLPEETKLTAADLEDSWEKDAVEFVLEGGDRETGSHQPLSADKENDLRSLNRKLDKKLFLVVKQRFGDKEHWMLPQGDHEQDESMRETAERTLRETCGDSIQSRFLGNAPCGFYREKLSKTLKDKLHVDGNKVFFFRAEYNQGSVIVSDYISDYKWLTVEEMADYLEPEYYKKCKMFISEMW